MRIGALVLALATATAVAGCGGETAVPSGETQPPPTQEQPRTRLTVRVSPDADAAATRWTLTCHPPGGTHPAPEAACDALQKAENPFAPVPPDQICTQIYGGPQTATIEGVWRGERISATFNRTDGCEIHRWNAIKAVLEPPTPSGQPSDS